MKTEPRYSGWCGPHDSGHEVFHGISLYNNTIVLWMNTADFSSICPQILTENCLKGLKRHCEIDTVKSKL